MVSVNVYKKTVQIEESGIDKYIYVNVLQELIFKIKNVCSIFNVIMVKYLILLIIYVSVHYNLDKLMVIALTPTARDPIYGMDSNVRKLYAHHLLILSRVDVSTHWVMDVGI